MPFAQMPNSGFQMQPAPDWGRFAEKAVELTANQPIQDTSAIIDRAVGQISGILKLASPEEKLKREMQREQLTAMRDLYKDYKANRGAYQMTANGPVLIDPLTRLSKIESIRASVARRRYLNKRAGGGGIPPILQQKLGVFKAAMNANPSDIPEGRDAVSYVPIGGAQATDTSTANYEDMATKIALEGNELDKPVSLDLGRPSNYEGLSIGD